MNEVLQIELENNNFSAEICSDIRSIIWNLSSYDDASDWAKEGLHDICLIHHDAKDNILENYTQDILMLNQKLSIQTISDANQMLIEKCQAVIKECTHPAWILFRTIAKQFEIFRHDDKPCPLYDSAEFEHEVIWFELNGSVFAWHIQGTKLIDLNFGPL
jgi:hypothetical protein